MAGDASRPFTTYVRLALMLRDAKGEEASMTIIHSMNKVWCDLSSYERETAVRMDALLSAEEEK